MLTEASCAAGSFRAALPSGATDADQQAGEPTGGDPAREACPVQPGATPARGCGGLQRTAVKRHSLVAGGILHVFHSVSTLYFFSFFP